MTSESLNELVEMQLLSMKTYLLKLNKYKAADRRVVPDGKIVLEKIPSVCHEYMLTEKPSRYDQRYINIFLKYIFSSTNIVL